MQLIDRDSLINGLMCIYRRKGYMVIRVLSECIQRIPTVDAVPVVRCKDCAKRGTINCDLDYCGYRQADNWFCADGERREEDDLLMCANHYGERIDDE